MFVGTRPRSPRNLSDIDGLPARSGLRGGGGGRRLVRVRSSGSLSLSDDAAVCQLSMLSTLFARRRRSSGRQRRLLWPSSTSGVTDGSERESSASLPVVGMMTHSRYPSRSRRRRSPSLALGCLCGSGGSGARRFSGQVGSVVGDEVGIGGSRIGSEEMTDELQRDGS